MNEVSLEIDLKLKNLGASILFNDEIYEFSL
jgi:hypothetical protein